MNFASPLRSVPFARNLFRMYETGMLWRKRPVRCNARALRLASEIGITSILNDAVIISEWQENEERIRRLGISAQANGVNPGDRRALFHLMFGLRPASVLEIGTHVGASTSSIALALTNRGGEEKVSLVTVDITDVNDPVSGPWVKHRLPYSPRGVMEQLGCERVVEFITSTARGYLEQTPRAFDLIFLDGDHSSIAVYEEIPAALEKLNNNGVILLHDYYPNGKPIWGKRAAISGPYLAVERLKAEGANLAVLPLGELPWPTKNSSNLTSLALLARAA